MSIGGTCRWLLTVLVISLSCGCADPVSPQLRVMTYNVNFGGPSMVEAAFAIRQSNADIVCLQETTIQWEPVLRRELSAQYPHMLFQHYHFEAGGLAVLSKYPIHETDHFLPLGGWFPALIARSDTPVGQIQLANIHLHPSMGLPNNINKPAPVSPVRRREIQSLLEHLDPTVPTLILGDFNENHPGLSLDRLVQSGYTNALPLFDTTSPTWRVTHNSRSFDARVDHIFFSPHFTCHSAEVLRAGQSDHYPLIAEFILSTQPMQHSDGKSGIIP